MRKRTLCKTNIKRALRKSWDTEGYVDVCDEWQACIYRSHGWCGVAPMTSHEVILWNWVTEREVRLGIGGCASMTETIEYATERLMAHVNERKAA